MTQRGPSIGLTRSGGGRDSSGATELSDGLAPFLPPSVDRGTFSRSLARRSHRSHAFETRFLRKLIFATQCRLFSVVARCGAPPVESQMCLRTPARALFPLVFEHPRGLRLSVGGSDAEPSTLDIAKGGCRMWHTRRPACRNPRFERNQRQLHWGPLLRAAPFSNLAFP